MNQIKLGESNMMYRICEGCENYGYCSQYQRLCNGKPKAIERRNLTKYEFKKLPGVKEYVKIFMPRINCYVVSFKYKGATYQYSCVEEEKPISIEVLKQLGSKEVYLSLSDLRECYEKYSIFEADLVAFGEMLERARVENNG